MSVRAKHHPPGEILLDFAGGRCDRPRRALIEAHLALCPACRGDIAEVSCAGGLLIDTMEVSSPPAHVLAGVLHQIDSLRAPSQPTPEIQLPPGVLAELSPKVSLAWRSRTLRGGRIALLAKDPGGASGLYLSYMPGGRVFPSHGHTGAEETVVLSGGYTDGELHVEEGDWVSARLGAEHAPVVDPGEGCWILTRLEGRVRFSGWRGWLQRLAR